MSEKNESTSASITLDKPVYLVGYMGTGKTTVAKAFEKATGIKAIDTDEEVVHTGGITIEDVFFRHGEQGFRNRETAQLKLASEGEPVIVACGGGVILREENIQILNDTGTVILLTAEPQTAHDRLAQVEYYERPLLKDHQSVGYIEQHMKEREPAYQEVADFTVVTDGKTPEEIVEEIIEILK